MRTERKNDIKKIKVEERERRLTDEGLGKRRNTIIKRRERTRTIGRKRRMR